MMKKINLLLITLFSFLFVSNVNASTRNFAEWRVSTNNNDIFTSTEIVQSFYNFTQTNENLRNKDIAYFVTANRSGHELAYCEVRYLQINRNSFYCSNNLHYLHYDFNTNIFSYTWDSTSWGTLYYPDLLFITTPIIYNSTYSYVYGVENTFPYSVMLPVIDYKNEGDAYLVFENGMPILGYFDLYYPDITGSMTNYSIEYYFDDIKDDSKTINRVSSKGVNVTDYDIYSDNIYHLRENYNFSVTSNNVFKVYYDSAINYTINYYFDNELDNSKVYNGVGKLNQEITFTDYTDDLYYLNESVTYDNILTGTNNIFNIFYNKKVYKSYIIEYYFDGVKDNSKTIRNIALVGTEITEFIDYTDDKYTLLEDMDYTLIINENENINILSIFYYSDLYGTDKQPIDTSSSWFYLFFSFQDIKNMFPNINFDNFNQFEQLIIVIIFNLLFVVFLVVMVYLVLKILYKVVQFIL